MLARPIVCLVFAVAVVVVVDFEPAEGGRGGRRVVAEVREVAFDLVRSCSVVRGGSGFAGRVFEVADVGRVDDGREAEIGEILEVEIIDTGLESLDVVDIGRGRATPALGACSATVDCVEVLGAATVLDLLRPNIPDIGLLLVLAAVVPDGGWIPLPSVPVRDLVAVEEAAPGLGSLLGDIVRGSAATELVRVVDTTAPWSFVPSLFVATASFLSSSLFCALPRPAVGCRRDRVRCSPDVEFDDDMAHSDVACRFSSPFRSAISVLQSPFIWSCVVDIVRAKDHEMAQLARAVARQ